MRPGVISPEGADGNQYTAYVQEMLQLDRASSARNAANYPLRAAQTG